MLEINQAGLSWLTVLKKREAFRRAYSDFDPEVIAAYGARDRRRLLADAGIIRNRLKVDAAIANAQRILELEKITRLVRRLARGTSPSQQGRMGHALQADFPVYRRRDRGRIPDEHRLPRRRLSRLGGRRGHARPLGQGHPGEPPRSRPDRCACRGRRRERATGRLHPFARGHRGTLVGPARASADITAGGGLRPPRPRRLGITQESRVRHHRTRRGCRRSRRCAPSRSLRARGPQHGRRRGAGVRRCTSRASRAPSPARSHRRRNSDGHRADATVPHPAPVFRVSGGHRRLLGHDLGTQRLGARASDARPARDATRVGRGGIQGNDAVRSQTGSCGLSRTGPRCHHAFERFPVQHPATQGRSATPGGRGNRPLDPARQAGGSESGSRSVSGDGEGER